MLQYLRRTRACPARARCVLALAPAILLWTGELAAQHVGAGRDTLRLGVEEAVRLALERSPALLLSQLDVAEAHVGVEVARAELRPQLSSTAGYTREIQPVDPFAGTRAGALLGAQGPTDWLTHNELARTDGDPGEQPISLPEFQERQAQAFREAGLARPGEFAGSPFSVPNQIQGGVSLSQPIYAPAAAAQVRGAQLTSGASVAGLTRQRAATADSVTRAYLGALLATEQAGVLERGVERARSALAEAVQRVQQGVAPVPERLTAEVDAANRRTEFLQSRVEEERALNQLKLTLGLSPGHPVVLTDNLTVEDGFALADVALEMALARALERRGDLEEARLAVAAQRAAAAAARALLRPSLNALLDVNMIGNVPDDRTRVFTDPLQPFEPEIQRRGILSRDFWNVGLTAGVQMQWGFFQGGRLRAQAEQARLGVRRSEIQLVRVRDLAEAQIEDALQEMRTARERAVLQAATVDLAERNYEAISARVRQGVAPGFERREASAQLDQSRLNLLQAIHDYLAGRSRFLAAVGLEPGEAW